MSNALVPDKSLQCNLATIGARCGGRIFRPPYPIATGNGNERAGSGANRHLLHERELSS